MSATQATATHPTAPAAPHPHAPRHGAAHAPARGHTPDDAPEPYGEGVEPHGADPEPHADGPDAYGEARRAHGEAAPGAGPRGEAPAAGPYDAVPGPRPGAPRWPRGDDGPQDAVGEVVRWAAFSCALVPAVLLVYGTSFAGAAGTALGLAAVTAVCRAVLRRAERGA
ncbi:MULTISPECIES: hypothetical protein, partial [unclassified Streptomyces]|uniref:hypothetical protein n=1 Tax=unclassified Streptomyces TaxID=2593676 RepID=UPI001D053B27